MSPQILFSSIFICLIVLLFFLNIFLSEKEFLIQTKHVWFESGIENKSSSRNSFSLNFFLICIIFVMFDLEIIFLFNYLTHSFLSFFLESLCQVVFLFLFFMSTLLLEWKLGTISWKY